MWMRKYLFLIFLYSLNSSLPAQKIEGIWISSNKMNIQKRTDSTYLEGVEILSKKLEKVKIDTFYHNAYALIHFLDNNEIIVQGIGGKKRLGSYTKLIDTLIVEIDTIKFKMIAKKENLILLDLDTGWQNNHLIFEKLLPSSSLSKDKIEFNFEKESYWKISTDSNSLNFGLEYHFLDSGNVILSQFNDGWNAYTSHGEYETIIYENDLFLYILDWNHSSGSERLFRIYSDSANRFFAQTFEENWKEPSSRQELVFIRAILPIKKELNEIKKSLLGTWALDDTLLPFDPDLSEYKSFDDQYYELIFSKNGEFSISYGGVLMDDNERIPSSKQIRGTWEVGSTGHYIKMKIDDYYIKYMTIIGLSTNSLSIAMDTESPDFEITYSNHQIRLKRLTRKDKKHKTTLHSENSSISEKSAK